MSYNLNGGGLCTVRSKLNKFDYVQGVGPVPCNPTPSADRKNDTDRQTSLANGNNVHSASRFSTLFLLTW